MAKYQKVQKVNDLIKVKRVLVSCTDKEGLISNRNFEIKGFPKCGIIGELAKVNPDIIFISTGSTYKLLSEAGYQTIGLAEYTDFPEMKTGLVKSLHPKVYAGILGHLYTEDDAIFMNEHGIEPIDLVIVNFYDLQGTIVGNCDCEDKRQAIDIGGPTLCHAARKSYINTALIADKGEYMSFIRNLTQNNGYISLKERIQMAKKASKVLTQLMLDIDNIVQGTSVDEIEKVYDVV